MGYTRIIPILLIIGLASCQPAVDPQQEPCGEMWGDFIIVKCEEM